MIGAKITQVENHANNTEGDTFDAFFGKVQRCLVGVIFNLCNLCTDQLIGIVDFFIDTIDESQLGKDVYKRQCIHELRRSSLHGLQR